MPVILTQPVEGKAVGEEYSGEREDWLVVQGYARRPHGTKDHLLDTDVKADQDPTLAQNREHRDEDIPHETDPTLEGEGATQLPSVEQVHDRPDQSQTETIAKQVDEAEASDDSDDEADAPEEGTAR